MGASLVVMMLAVHGAAAAKAAPAKPAPAAAEVNVDKFAKQVPALLGKQGLTLDKQLPPLDADGDGKQEILTAGKDENGEITLVLFKADAKGISPFWTSPKVGGQELVNLQWRNMVGDKKQE